MQPRENETKIFLRSARARWMFLVPVLLAVAALIVVFTWPREDQPEVEKQDTDLIARVGDREIRVADFKREMHRRGGVHPEKLDKRKLLEEMIQRKTLLSKATQLGLAREPDVVRQRENILIGELRRDKLEPVLQGVKVSDVDVEEYYEQHRPKFTIASKRRLAMIYIKTHRKMPPEKLSECRERARQARAAALSQPHSKTMGDFGKMAIKCSEDQTTRYKGGDIGWITEGRERYRWPDEVVAAAFALNNVGDVSEVVATPTGLYIVKFSDHREAVVTPIEKVATQIRHTLILQKRRQAEKTFLVRIRDSFEIEIYSDVLKSVPTIAPNASPSRDAEPPALR